MAVALETPSNLQAALYLAKHGFKVIPLHHPVNDGKKCSCRKDCDKSIGKHPIFPDWSSYATDEMNEIHRLWGDRPQANIGVPMGSINGLFALDVDGREGKETLQEWIATYGELPPTLQIDTGGGGIQLWYKIPNGKTIPNSVKKIGINVDLRGEGGQSVAPGSLHKSGKRYQWSVGRSPEEVQPAFPPYWLMQMIEEIAESQMRAKRDGMVFENLHLNIKAPPKEKLTAVMKRSTSLQEIAQGKRAYESASQRDMALANILAIHDFTGDEIATTLYHFRKAHNENTKHLLYYQLTVGAALQWAKKQKAEQEAMEQAALEKEQAEIDALKQMMGENSSSDLTTSPPMNPLLQKKHVINITDEPIHVLADQAWEAIKAKNHPPTLFVRNWRMVTIRTDDEGRSQLHELDEPSLRGILDRSARWMKWKMKGKDVEEVPTQPPRYVVQDMLVEPDMPLPQIQGITHAPVFSPAGEIETEPGYLSKSKLYYSPLHDCEIPEVSTEPKDSEVKDAVDLLINELLIDFPFSNQASRAHALSMLFLPFVRQMVKGPTPLHLIDAPKRGAGKSFLARIAHFITTGTDGVMNQLPKTEEETEKQLVSLLGEGRPMVIFDNVTGRIERNSLNSLLTSTRYSGRLLGQSKMIELPNVSTWVMTGNNVDLNGDIYRRVAWIRLLPQTVDNFAHPDLIDWVEQNRGNLIHAILTIIQHWIAQGKPKGKNLLPSFEAWARTIGGIFEVAGIKGFLDNLQELEEQADQEGLMWEQFVNAWANKFEFTPTPSGLLWKLAVDEDMLHDVLGDRNERSQKSRIGRELRKQKDRTYGEYKICSQKDSHKKTMVYWLEKIE